MKVNKILILLALTPLYREYLSLLWSVGLYMTLCGRYLHWLCWLAERRRYQLSSQPEHWLHCTAAAIKKFIFSQYHILHLQRTYQHCTPHSRVTSVIHCWGHIMGRKKKKQSKPWCWWVKIFLILLFHPNFIQVLQQRIWRRENLDSTSKSETLQMSYLPQEALHWARPLHPLHAGP